MIKSAHIQNFQSHKDSLFEFVNGVNVIIGLSDSGKSAVMRALRWAIYNRPTGEEFRSTWGGRSEVSIGIGEKSSIIRGRDSGDNSYFMDNKGALTIFEAIGTDVPEDISKALNINEINVQHQLDRPFLLDDSPGEVAAHFNRVAHLDQIDSATSNVNKWIRDIQANITASENTKESLEKELTEYDDIDMMEQDLEVLEDMEKRMIGKINADRKLTETLEYIETVTEKIADLEKVTKQESDIDKLIKIVDDRDEVEMQSRDLERLLNDVENTQADYMLQNSTAKRLQEKFNREFPDVCPFGFGICKQKPNQ